MPCPKKEAKEGEKKEKRAQHDGENGQHSQGLQEEPSPSIYDPAAAAAAAAYPMMDVVRGYLVYRNRSLESAEGSIWSWTLPTPAPPVVDGGSRTAAGRFGPSPAVVKDETETPPPRRERIPPPVAADRWVHLRTAAYMAGFRCD